MYERHSTREGLSSLPALERVMFPRGFDELYPQEYTPFNDGTLCRELEYEFDLDDPDRVCQRVLNIERRFDLVMEVHLYGDIDKYVNAE